MSQSAKKSGLLEEVSALKNDITNSIEGVKDELGGVRHQLSLHDEILGGHQGDDQTYDTLQQDSAYTNLMGASFVAANDQPPRRGTEAPALELQGFKVDNRVIFGAGANTSVPGAEMTTRGDFNVAGTDGLNVPLQPRPGGGLPRPEHNAEISQAHPLGAVGESRSTNL